MPVERLTPERRRELTRTALIEAAADVFTRRGFHAASLDEIAEVAGFTRGAIYSNFGGKEEMLIAVLDLLTDRQLIAFEKASEGTPEERMAAAGAIWSHSQREQQLPALSLEIRLYALRHPDFRRRLAAAERRQQEQIAAFIEHVASADGRPLPFAAGDLAEMLRAFSDGLAQLAAVDEERSGYYENLAVQFFGLIDQAMSVDAPPKRKAKKR